MGIIRVLPQTVINKIAAGEVVERPASVVKELVENSLDAGATRVEIEVEEGGRKLIRVIDNGQGMDAEDVALAFESHSTSKLRDSTDLFFITTMGFRGEALPSIGAVAQVRLVSRLRGSSSACEIAVHGGRKSEAKACGAPEGTQVEVRNLFFNVPARRKFLRSAGTEMSHIVEIITQIALAHPGVQFVLKRAGKDILNSPAGQDRLQRLADFFTHELAETLLEVDGGKGAVRITGYVAPPEQSKVNTRMQYFFLNRRPVRDKGLTRALMDAYAGLLPAGRFPPAFLFVQIDPREVDVNVSPTKISVRFRDAQTVYLAVRQAVASALSAHDLQPQIPINPRSETASASAIGRPDSKFLRSAGPPSLPLSWRTPAAETGERPQCPPTMAHPSPRAVQMLNSFIVVEQDDGLEIIDQHALHERILYEQISGRLAGAPLETQRLLVPEVVELTRQEMENLLPILETAARMGLEVESFGDRAVAVQAVPALLSGVGPAQLLRDVLDALTEEKSEHDAAATLERLMRLIACKAAVKAGQALSDEEIRALLERRTHIHTPETCPHGRPASLRLTLEQLERHFRRK